MKGRLLENQLDSNDNLAQDILVQCAHILSALTPHDILATGDLVIKLTEMINEKNLMILPCQNQATYTNLLKCLEILMYFDEHNDQIDALPENNAVKEALSSIQKKIVEQFSAKAQWKDFPGDISEYNFNLVLINYSDQAISVNDVNLDVMRDCYKHYKDCPIIVKCGEKIFCYGLVEDGEYPNIKMVEKITELEAGKFSSLQFPQEKNTPQFIDKRDTSVEVQKAIKAQSAHEVFTDYIFDRNVYFGMMRSPVRFADTIAEMILLGLEKIIDRLPPTEKNTKPISHIVQLIKNSKHKWSKKLDIHLRESLGGTKYESTNHEKSWMGLVKILRYVYTNPEIMNSYIGMHFTEYLSSLRKENLTFVDKEILSLENDNKKRKAAVKGVVRNDQGTYNINEFQYLLDKKSTPQAPATKEMKELIEAIFDNLHVLARGGVAQPKARYIIGPDNKKNCILSFPIKTSPLDKSKRYKNEVRYRDFNITVLLKNQPLAHEINFSKEKCRYAVTAMVGCNLYVLASGTKATIEQLVKNKSIVRNSCVITCEVESKKSDQSISVNQVYYVNYTGKIELLEAELNIADIANDQELNTELAKAMKPSAWLGKKLLNKTSDPLLVSVEYKPEKKFKAESDLFISELRACNQLYVSISDILSSHQLVTLYPLTLIAAPSEHLPFLRKKGPLYRTLTHADAAAIKLYTTDYYKIMQNLLRSFCIFSKDIFLPDPETGLKNAYAIKCQEKLGEDFENSPVALCRFMADIIFYNYFISHGVANIIQENQKVGLKNIKSKFNNDNCNLFIISKIKDIKNCLNVNKDHGIILYRQAKKEKTIIYHCIGNKLVKKIMDIDLAVTVKDSEFLSHFSKKNDPKSYYSKLIALTCLPRQGNLVVLDPEDDSYLSHKKLVNKFIHYAMWYCENNTFDHKVHHCDMENIYINYVRYALINNISSDGLFLSTANEVGSFSLRICRAFVTWDGKRIVTVVHIPKTFIPIVKEISNVYDEFEALYSPNTKVVYFKVEKDASFRNIIYHGILTDYDFNINDPKWKNLVDAQLKSELYTSIEFTKQDIKTREKKIPQVFKQFLDKANHLSDDEKAKIKPYFETSKPIAEVQLSCIQGTPVEIISELTPENPISQIKHYAKSKQIKNTYVLLPIKKETILSVKSKDPGIESFRLYYVKDAQNIVEIKNINQQESASICEELNTFFTSFSSLKDKKIIARECLKQESIALLAKFVHDQNDPILPLILGIAGNQNKLKRRSSNLSKNSLVRRSTKNIHPPLLHANGKNNRGANEANKESLEKLEELTQLVVQSCHLQEELKQYEREERLIKGEEAVRSVRESTLMDGRKHYIEKDYLLHTAEQFITIINKKQGEKCFSEKWSFHLEVLKKIVKLLQEGNRKISSLFKVMQENLTALYAANLIAGDSKKDVFKQLRNKADIVFLLYIYSKLSEIFPLESKKLIKEMPEVNWLQEGISFDEMNELTKSILGMEISKPVSSQDQININFTILKDLGTCYKNYVIDHAHYADAEEVKLVKQIIDMFNACTFKPLDKEAILEKYTALNGYLSGMKKSKKFLLTTQQSALMRLMSNCKQLLDPIVPAGLFVDTAPISLHGQPSSPAKRTNYLIRNNKVFALTDKSQSPKGVESPIALSSSSQSDSLVISGDLKTSKPKLPSREILKIHSLFAESPKSNVSVEILAESLMSSIDEVNMDSVNEFLVMADEENKLAEVLRFIHNKGQTPLHAAIIKLQAGLKSQDDIQQLPEAAILQRLLSAHAKAGVKITSEHKNAEGISPVKLAMKIDKTERLADFLMTQSQSAVQATNNKSLLLSM